MRKAKISYKIAKKNVEQKMKMLKIASKMHLKVSSSTFNVIQKSKDIIKKPIKLNKADIKITTKIMESRSEDKILEKNMALIEKIKKSKKIAKAKKKALIAKKKKIVKKIEKKEKKKDKFSAYHKSKVQHKRVFSQIKKSISKQIIQTDAKISKLQSVIKHSKDKVLIAKAKISLRTLKAVA